MPFSHNESFKSLFIFWLCEILSSHGGEYDIQSCLLGCAAHGSTTQKTALNIIFWLFECGIVIVFIIIMVCVVTTATSYALNDLVFACRASHNCVRF
jgi:hypothetical protein